MVFVRVYCATVDRVEIVSVIAVVVVVVDGESRVDALDGRNQMQRGARGIEADP